MLLNEYLVNEEQINGELSSDGVETLLFIQKDIQLQASASGSLVSIEKQIYSTGAGSLLEIEKRIIAVAANNSFYARNGWEPIITLGGLTLSADELHGSIKVVKQEDDNHSAEFTIILSPAVYDLYNFQGKRVVIRVRKNNTVRIIFTGIVDTPRINVIEEKLTLSCIADRRVLIANLEILEPYIGYYSPEILGDNNDTYERISARMSTIPVSLDFDGSNNFSFTSWTPAATPDFSYGSNAVYRRAPNLQLESASKLINTVNVTLEYGYQRAHHREILYHWAHPYKPADSTGTQGICSFLAVRPTMPTKDLIRAAINGTGWPLKSEPSFSRQFASGNYQCSGVWASWSTVQTSYLNAGIVDANGNPVTDASGNQLYRSVPTIVQDNTDLYTMGADFTLTKRFNQNIKESYTCVVSAPTSVATYGTLSSAENYGISNQNQNTEWENYTAYQSPPSGVTTYPNNPTASYFFNVDTDRSTFNVAFVCALNKAKTTILKNHRDTFITFQRELTPELELYHTVELTGKWVRGKGKCKSITQVMCISDSNDGAAGEAYSDVTLAQYRSVSASIDSSLTPPSPVEDVPNVQIGAISLQTHLGVDPESVGSENWTGYVGNISSTVNGQYTRTDYQESFIINAPAIEEAVRSDKELIQTTFYSIDIPQDNTEYEAYG